MATTCSNVGNLSASYSYDPYGNTRSATATSADAGSNPLRYTGWYYDTATGLYEPGARCYDPTTGRFIQPDPSGQEENPYLYAGGHPLH